MGSDESHFNVSVGSDGQSHRTVSTNHNLFEEKEEPKRYRTEVLPLTSLTPYRKAKPAQVLKAASRSGVKQRSSACLNHVPHYAPCRLFGRSSDGSGRSVLCYKAVNMPSEDIRQE